MNGSILIRLAALGGLCALLSEAKLAAWVVGIPTVLLAVALSAWFPKQRPWHVRPAAFLAFLPYFVDQSIRAGLDVAKRAVARDRRLHPALVSYRLRLPAGPAQVFFMNSITVMPGTLSARVQDHILQVHLLDRRQDWTADLARLESRVAAIFGLSLQDRPESSGT